MKMGVRAGGATRRTLNSLLLVAFAAAALLPRDAAASPAPLGVTFFGASWCPWCKGAAAILKALVEKGHIELLTISLDQRPIGPLDAFVPDTGEAAAMGVSGVPVTIIFDPASGAPVARIDGFRGYGPYLGELRAAAAAIRKGEY